MLLTARHDLNVGDAVLVSGRHMVVTCVVSVTSVEIRDARWYERLWLLWRSVRLWLRWQS
jgi:hypothetical protein